MYLKCDKLTARIFTACKFIFTVGLGIGISAVIDYGVFWGSCLLVGVSVAGIVLTHLYLLKMKRDAITYAHLDD